MTSDMQDTDDTRGLSQRELLLEQREALIRLDEKVDELKDGRVAQTSELGKRPTRAEIYTALGGASIILGLVSRMG